MGACQPKVRSRRSLPTYDSRPPTSVMYFSYSSREIRPLSRSTRARSFADKKICTHQRVSTAQAVFRMSNAARMRTFEFSRSDVRSDVRSAGSCGNFADSHPNYQLRDARGALNAQPMWLFEIDEQQAHARSSQDSPSCRRATEVRVKTRPAWNWRSSKDGDRAFTRLFSSEITVGGPASVCD